MNTPILLLAFNRPDKTAMIFERIRNQRPCNLYISIDGPRNSKDRYLCEQVKEIVNNIDWPCMVKYKINEINLGCGKAVSTGIDWFFQEVEQGIILEDDILPSEDFFRFCECLLERYKANQDVLMISGYNSNYSQGNTEFNYFFSKYPLIWGWATWRDRWKQYDFLIRDWPNCKTSILSYFTDNLIKKVYIKLLFDRLYSGQIDTWDYQFLFLSLRKRMSCIVPMLTLTENIGFDESGTHTTKHNKKLVKVESMVLGVEIKHPQSVDVTKFNYDEAIETHVMGMHLLGMVKQIIRTLMK